MRRPSPTKSDRFGLVRATVEAHAPGIGSMERVLRDCGYQVVVGDAEACEVFGRPEGAGSFAALERWLRENRITVLGFSSRSDSEEGADLFGRLVRHLRSKRLFADQGGPLKAVYFAGFPAACKLVQRRVPEAAGAFRGDETPAETLVKLGIDPGGVPNGMAEGIGYDEARLAFARDLVRTGDYLQVRPVDRDGYDGFGTLNDTLVGRLRHGQERGLPPVMRAHVGAYHADRALAIRLFLEWTRRLAGSGLLDVLSISTSQLTQSAFGENWDGRANGGGVPINSSAEFGAVWEAARPMLVRTYAGTKGIPALARTYEDTLKMAWHTLSLWWFSRLDGRGPYSVRENLEQHIETIRYVASVGKPFEPNVPHQFAFCGADDVTYVVSAVIAAKAARRLGVRHLVLQNTLNTPRYTWGVQDLAKSRAMLQLVRELESDSFHVILQPRAGPDYFSPDIDRAKIQLAAVTALMDDIEPHDANSPPIIHVAGYSEASFPADPAVVDDSIRITRHALEQYRKLRAKGYIDDMTNHPEVASRTATLVEEARTVIAAIEASVPSPYSPEGLYRILAAGFLAVPYLWECRDEFGSAIRWQTRPVRGSVKVVDAQGDPITAATRMEMIVDAISRHT